MAYQIIWTAEADDDFRSIFFYLKENWSVNSAEKFGTCTMKRLERIAEMRYEPKFTSKPGVQMIKLDRKNVLFFSTV
jgi:plasmid stabilization system protein ParE